jgi:DNA-binding CsgD family transcriptional regulator
VQDPHPAAEDSPLFAALSRSPDAVFVTDRHNRIVFWNRSAERLFGYTSAEAVGTSCASLLEGSDAHDNRYCSENCPITQMAARNESVRNFDLRLHAKDRTEILTDVSILHFVATPPDGFFLAHILQPARGQVAAADRPTTESTPAPRPTLVTVRESPDARARRLTSREVEVLGLLAAGHATAEIAARLFISNLTARNHIQNILDKLEVHSKTEAVAFAFQKRLV